MPPLPVDDAPARRRPFRIGDVVRDWFAWGLDYDYVGYWMTRSTLGRADPERYLLSAGSKAPVVLLPGVYERWQFLRPLADHLSGGGHPVHVVPALRWNTASVIESARIVSELIAERDLRGAIIVAHSKGGLIGKSAMLQDPQGRIDRMVAIATPFSGSVYARFLIGATLRAFSPRNATLMAMGAQLEVNSRITSIWGRFDPHIPGGSALSGATNIRLRSSGHFRILGTQELRTAVDAALDGPPADRDATSHP
jgi:pimeloyl-ACP methyl ester carboxylesterase